MHVSWYMCSICALHGAHTYVPDHNTTLTPYTILTPHTSHHNRVAVVAEQLLRLLHACGMPLTDVDFLCGRGPAMNHVMNEAQPRSTLFTGSKRVAEKLAVDMHGKVYFLCVYGGGRLMM